MNPSTNSPQGFMQYSCQISAKADKPNLTYTKLNLSYNAPNAGCLRIIPKSLPKTYSYF